MKLSDSHKISQEKWDFKISDVLITAWSYHLAFKSCRIIAFFQKLLFNDLFFGVKEAFSHYPMALFPIIGASSSVG